MEAHVLHETNFSLLHELRVNQKKDFYHYTELTLKCTFKKETKIVAGPLMCYR